MPRERKCPRSRSVRSIPIQRTVGATWVNSASPKYQGLNVSGEPRPQHQPPSAHFVTQASSSGIHVLQQPQQQHQVVVADYMLQQHQNQIVVGEHVYPDLMSMLSDPPPLIALQPQTQVQPAQVVENDRNIITASPEMFSGDEDDDDVIASSPEPAAGEEEVQPVETSPAASVRMGPSTSAAVSVQPTAGPAPPPKTSSPTSSGKNFSLLKALYDIPVYHVPEAEKHIPTPPPTTPPQVESKALESDDEEGEDQIFVGLNVIQDNYEEGLSSAYHHLKTGSAAFVSEITALDKRRKKVVKKLQQYYNMMLRIKNKLNTLQRV